MGLFSRNAERRFDGGDITTVVGAEAYFQGALTVRGSLRVDGEVEGNILEAQTVIVSGPRGRVHGDICAEVVVVSGTVTGDVTASGHLELKPGGRVIGNIRTSKLTIDDGAVFEGRCVMSEAPSDTPKPSEPVHS